MAEIVNLKRARKNKARKHAQAAAAQQRAAHGQPKVKRKLETARRAHDQARLDGHRLDDPDGDA